MFQICKSNLTKKTNKTFICRSRFTVYQTVKGWAAMEPQSHTKWLCAGELEEPVALCRFTDYLSWVQEPCRCRLLYRCSAGHRKPCRARRLSG